MKRFAIAALSLALASFTFAADAPKPKPDPALKQLDIFAGTWQCKGTQTFTGKTIHYTGSETGAWALDGQWLDVRVTQVKTKENPMPYNGRAYMGYDAGSKKFYSTWVDNTGGYEAAEFNGWQGDKMTMEGTTHMGPMVAKGRDVFTKSGKTLTHTFELEQNGKWTELLKETCTR